MKVLVITDVLWRTDNGVGNTYSNFFFGMDCIEIQNICCQEGESDNDVSQKCYQISEKQLINNLFNNDLPVGRIEEPGKKGGKAADNSAPVKDENLIKFVMHDLMRTIKACRPQVLLWARNMVWSLGTWKNENLKQFINDFSPDLIFAQLQDKMYQNNLVAFVQKYTNCPLVLYVWDDVYSMKQFYLSPLYWCDRLLQRRSIRKLTQRCSLMYTICKEQQEEYASSLNVKTALLQKGKDFRNCRCRRESTGSQVVQFLYTGNLYSGRYKTLLRICEQIALLNEHEMKAQIHIYSGTDLSERQKQKLNIGQSSFFLGKVSERKVAELQKKADVLVHIEPFSIKGSLLCRLSFSTKIVDYLYHGKCIFACGSDRCASIKYLKRHNSAIVATSLNSIQNSVSNIVNNPTLIEEYSDRAWECGARNHQIDDIQSALYQELQAVVQGTKK